MNAGLQFLFGFYIGAITVLALMGAEELLRALAHVLGS